MKIKSKKIENITFQFCALQDILFLEFLDENNNAFMDIEYNDNKEYKINFYKSEDHISIPLEKFVEGIEIIKKQVNKL